MFASELGRAIFQNSDVEDHEEDNSQNRTSFPAVPFCVINSIYIGFALLNAEEEE